MQTVTPAVARTRELFDSGATRPLAWRLEQLGSLRRMLGERRAEFIDALGSDLGKHRTEAQLAEIGFVTAEAAHLERHLEGWLRPRPVPVPLAVQPAKAWTELTPLGVVLVIGPWNYPLQLVLARWPARWRPATPRCSNPANTPRHLGRPGALDPGIPRRSRRGGRGRHPGDHRAAGRTLRPHLLHRRRSRGQVVLRAAAKNLTPVTLELGGKSPAFVDASTDLAKAAKRIAWGRFINAGQTCVAPDYVLATPEVLDGLEHELVKAITALFGADSARSESYGRIVDDRHFQRLAALADGSTVVHGGQRDAATRYFAPTLLRPAPGDAVMAEEIFGPLLPLVPVSGRGEAIRIDQRPRQAAGAVCVQQRRRHPA